MKQAFKNIIGWWSGLGRCVTCGNTRWRTDVFYVPYATCWRCFLADPARDQNTPVHRDDYWTVTLIHWI
jgi:hypothetical protein